MINILTPGPILANYKCLESGYGTLNLVMIIFVLFL